MKQEDIDAIHHGIAKYDRYAHGLSVVLGIRGCLLCGIYLSVCSSGCPIMKKTMKPGCEGTPYEIIEKLALINGNYNPGESWCLCHAIEDEIEFLISLLPEKEQRRYSLEEI